MSLSKREQVIRIFRSQRLVVAILLSVLTFLIYAPVRNHAFVGLDDNRYVTENIWIQQGLNLESLSWAMTSFKEGVWNPVTWISFMLDYRVFGLDPAGCHFTNLILHLVSVILLFIMLHQLTGAFWRSAVVAALFASHPLNVESVAWITERKNVLSTLFGLLTMNAYLGYVRRPSWKRYLLVTIFLSLGLMAKQMLVTLPCLLLLLDYWPLARLGETWEEFRKHVPRLILEKLPLMIPVVGASVLTVIAAQSIDGISSLPVGSRLANAILSYALYLKKMVWPIDLAVFYPYRGGSLGLGSVGLAALILIAISWGVWRLRKSGYLVVGWLWYLGTLFPVSGVIQVGGQAMADRHAYVPLIGVFIMLVWGAEEVAHHLQLGKRWQLGAGVCAVTILAVLTQFYLSYWENTRTLFEHTLNVTSHNYIAHNALGLELKQQGDSVAAMAHFQQALEIDPQYAKAYNNLGMVLAEQGQLVKAINHFSEALRLNPRLLDAHNNLGMVYSSQGKFPDAIRHFSAVLNIDPNYVRAHANMGLLMAAQNNFYEAIVWYQRALDISPRLFGTHNNLGLALMETGQLDQAAIHFDRAITLNPNSAIVYINSALVKMRTGQMDDAEKNLTKAIEIKPDISEAYYYLGNIKTHQGEVQAARDYYQKVLDYDPDNLEAHKRLSALHTEE